MYAHYVEQIRNQIFENDEYTYWVSRFGLNYSLIEALWKDIPELGNIDEFCKKFSKYYWSLQEIKDKAITYASMECVGSSRINRYGNTQTEEIAHATMYLRHESDISQNISVHCTGISGICRQEKTGSQLCIGANGQRWKTRRDHCDNSEYASFKALMYIIRQVRNNLFHGNKYDLEKQQFKRNMVLVRTSSETTEIILDNISNAESA